MELLDPLCRKSKYNKELTWDQIDYMNQFPLGNENRLDFHYPCRGFQKSNITKTLIAGQTFISRIAGDVPHNGGHCEWSLTYDEKTFVVIHSVFGECLTKGIRAYEIQLPKELPNGNVVLSWTWINRTGIREYYMNCADIRILNNNNNNLGYVIGPNPVIANLPGYPTIQQFNNGVLGEEFYINRDLVKIGLDLNGISFNNIIKKNFTFKYDNNNILLKDYYNN